jgi:hypothetical protein
VTRRAFCAQQTIRRRSLSSASAGRRPRPSTAPPSCCGHRLISGALDQIGAGRPGGKQFAEKFINTLVNKIVGQWSDYIEPSDLPMVRQTVPRCVAGGGRSLATGDSPFEADAERAAEAAVAARAGAYVTDRPATSAQDVSPGSRGRSVAW